MQKIAFHQMKKAIEWNCAGQRITCMVQSAIVPERETVIVAVSETVDSTGKLSMDFYYATVKVGG